MSAILLSRKNGLIFGLPLVLFAILAFLIKLTPQPEGNVWYFALTIDLLLTVPLIYFWLIRKTAVPKTTVIPVMLLGLGLGYALLPLQGQTYLTLFKLWALPWIEISVLAFLLFKVHSALKRFRQLRGGYADFYTVLLNTCRELLPGKLVRPLATEIAVIYYGCIRWRSPVLSDTEFSYHRNSGTPVLMLAFILIIGIETFVLHSLIARWSEPAAWILTALSCYTALQVLGFAKSLAQRPIAIRDKILDLRYGILNEASIPLKEIERITLSSGELPDDKSVQKLSPLGTLESHNVIITLTKEHTFTGLYGIQRQSKAIAFYLDDPVSFQNTIDSLVQQRK